MKKKQYICPKIISVTMEGLMEPGLHNSVADTEELSKETTIFEEEDDFVPLYHTKSVWDE